MGRGSLDPVGEGLDKVSCDTGQRGHLCSRGPDTVCPHGPEGTGGRTEEGAWLRAATARLRTRSAEALPIDVQSVSSAANPGRSFAL